MCPLYVRSGTLPHHLCVGFGAACRIAAEEMERDAKWVDHLSKRMYDNVMARVPEVRFCMIICQEVLEVLHDHCGQPQSK
jgi:cysteine sulfinate desulfinase/cysteine desulfurase-like protein